MTRKDYELIAAAIKRHLNAQCEPEHKSFQEAVMSDLSHDLAGELKAANNAFNVTKFLRACGVS